MARAGIGSSSGVRTGAVVGLTEEEAALGEGTGATRGETRTLGAGQQQSQQSQPQQGPTQQTQKP